MKMIAHQTKAQHTDIKTEDRYRNIIHPCNKILTTSENVVSFQPVAAYMIVPFHSFFFDNICTLDLCITQFKERF